MHINWSRLGLGAVFIQMDDNGTKLSLPMPIAPTTMQKLNTILYKGKCLPTIWAIAHFRCYMYSNQLLFVTDHQPMKWIMKFDKLTRKLARWALTLREYDFRIVLRAWLVSKDANGLSHNPCPSHVDSTSVCFVHWRG